MAAIAKKFKFSENHAAEVVGVSLKTYRKMAPSFQLSVGASERIIKLSELYETGITAFDGDSRSFLGWLNTSIPALVNFMPFELVTTFVGISIVQDELLRMEYSVP